MLDPRLYIVLVQSNQTYIRFTVLIYSYFQNSVHQLSFYEIFASVGERLEKCRVGKDCFEPDGHIVYFGLLCCLFTVCDATRSVKSNTNSH